jgi:hypothetical protein
MLILAIEFGTVSSVLWIRIGLNAVPEPSFYISADLDLDPDRLLMSQKVT